MRSYLKYVLATITGIVIVAGLFVLVIVALVSSKSTEGLNIKDGSVLHLKLNYKLDDRVEQDIFDILGSLEDDMDNPVGLIELLAQIEDAGKDDRIKGIFLDLSLVDAGYAKLAELRNALLKFRETGKFVIAYSDMFYNPTYYLASAADKVYLNPKGTFIFNGMVADVTFIREAMDKLGIELQPIKRGKFKGAVEPFVLDSLSPANRLQIEAYLNSVYGSFINGLAEQRDIPVEEVDRIADNMLVKNPTEALEHKLVDELLYRDEVYTAINMLMNRDPEDKLHLLKPGRYENRPANGVETDDRIAVVYAEGAIVNGKGDKEEIGGETFAAALRKIRKDDKVKAVVLRINSGGGSALASEIIWREAELLRKEKPLIVSMGDYAASGGYYIACMADTILAMPNTITGSIGVFGLYPNIEELLDDIGVNVDYVGTGNRSEFGRIDKPLSKQDLAVIDTLIGDVYRSFLERVADGRGMTTQEVDSIAQGRVWTGEMAKKIGLIDGFGGFEDALKIAAARAGIEKYKVVGYPRQDNKLSRILQMADPEQARQDFLRKELGQSYKYYELVKIATSLNGIQAMMPFTIVIE